jgi:hypothetical protein
MTVAGLVFATEILAASLLLVLTPLGLPDAPFSNWTITGHFENTASALPYVYNEGFFMSTRETQFRRESWHFSVAQFIRLLPVKP